MSETKPITPEAILARYQYLVAQRDETEARVAPIKERLAAASAKAEEARVAAMNIRDELDRARGGWEGWHALKREIRLLADLARKLKVKV